MTAAAEAGRLVTLERTLEATPEDVWELWTTPEGLESWWGPGGFLVRVQRLELGPGGVLEYTMTAVGADQIAYLERAGRTISTSHRATYTEVVPMRRLAYEHMVDFIPGVAPYSVSHVVEIHVSGDRVRMVLTFDAMHNEEWTRLARMGWESELEKLAVALA